MSVDLPHLKSIICYGEESFKHIRKVVFEGNSKVSVQMVDIPIVNTIVLPNSFRSVISKSIISSILMIDHEYRC